MALTAQISSPPKISEQVSTHSLYLSRREASYNFTTIELIVKLIISSQYEALVTCCLPNCTQTSYSTAQRSDHYWPDISADSQQLNASHEHLSVKCACWDINEQLWSVWALWRVAWVKPGHHWCVSSAHLSVMATCSNMADPVLLFQLPEMDVLLEKEEKLCIKWSQTSFICRNYNYK